MSKTYVMTVRVTDRYGELIDPDDRYRTLKETTAVLQEVLDDGFSTDDDNPNIVVEVTEIIEDTSGYEVEYDSGGGPYAQREGNL